MCDGARAAVARRCLSRRPRDVERAGPLLIALAAGFATSASWRLGGLEMAFGCRCDASGCSTACSARGSARSRYWRMRRASRSPHRLAPPTLDGRRAAPSCVAAGVAAYARAVAVLNTALVLGGTHARPAAPRFRAAPRRAVARAGPHLSAPPLAAARAWRVASSRPSSAGAFLRDGRGSLPVRAAPTAQPRRRGVWPVRADGGRDPRRLDAPEARWRGWRWRAGTAGGGVGATAARSEAAGQRRPPAPRTPKGRPFSISRP